MYWNQNHCYFFLGSVIILEFSVQNKYALRQQKIQALSYFLVGKYLFFSYFLVAGQVFHVGYTHMTRSPTEKKKIKNLRN